MKEQRKLAAIMFTDIVSYTSLMSKDEQHALSILQKSRDILKQFIKQFDGEWLQAIGDGTLSSFASVVDAVNCALEVQRSTKGNHELSLRIGIHIGDVVIGEDEIYGDGVNVASRLETLAEPGGICISGQVYRNIRNRPDIEAVFLGEKTLKNVDLPLKIYALTVEEPSAVAAKPYPTERPASEKHKPSIAVLPFINLSADPEQEYFCDGMTEEIINTLTHVENLRVVARTSAYSFKGRHEDIREIGRTLNVETVLEGSVRKAGNLLRITAQLINVEDGYHLWSEHYDREMEDVFAIQDAVSMAVVEVLKVKLLKSEKTKLVKRHTDNLEAYRLYLKGRYVWNRRYEGGMKKGLEYFQQAIEKDPLYALPYVGIADTFNIMGFYSFLPPKEAYPKAKAAATKALEIDDTLAEAHTSMAWISAFYDWDWLAAESRFKKAIALNPGYAMAHSWYSVYLAAIGRFDEAIKEAKIAQELEPLGLIINAILGVILYLARQYDEAIEKLSNTLEMDPNFLLANIWLAWSYGAKGLHKEAISTLEKAVTFSGNMSYLLGILGEAYCHSGQKDEALKRLKQLNELAKEKYVSPLYKAWIYIGLNKKDQAFKYLEKACSERDSNILFAKVALNYDLLRDDPRFKALMKKIGLDK